MAVLLALKKVGNLVDMMVVKTENELYELKVALMVAMMVASLVEL